MVASWFRGAPKTGVEPSGGFSGSLRDRLKVIVFGWNGPGRKSFWKFQTFSPEASWLLGSSLLFFGVFGAGSPSARSAFLGGFGPLEPVLMWFMVWSLVASLAFLGFASLSRTPAKSFAHWALLVLLFVGFFLLVEISVIPTTSTWVLLPEILRIRWATPVFGLLASLVGASAMYFGFQLYRRFLEKALEVQPFSLAVAIFILGGYFAVLSFFLPEGVNSSFTSNLWPVLWGTAFLLFSGVGISRQSPSLPRAKPKIGSPWPIQSFVLALVPLIPICRYFVTNLDVFSTGDIVILLAVTAGLAMVAIVAIPVVLGSFVDPKIHSITTSAGLYVLFNMASLSESRAWHQQGNLAEQIALLLVVFLVLGTFSRLRSSAFALIVGAFLALEIILSLGADGPGADLSLGAATSGAQKTAEKVDLIEESNWAKTVTGNPWVATPDVYLLAFESYANEETMDLYNIDNSQQIDFLIGSGFTIYDGTYSVASSSIPSMSRVLSVSSSPSIEGRRATSGESLVTDIFKSRGYATHGVFPSDYLLRGFTPTYSSFFPPVGLVQETAGPLTAAVLRGEFLFDEGFVTVRYEQYLEKKRKVLSLNSPTPNFLYSHNKYPGHSQNSGDCFLPDEVERYAEGLSEANREMKLDISAIPDLDNAIVIIAGDHGPYLTKNCTGLGSYPLEEIDRLDYQDRYGAFLAIRWPGEIPNNSRIQILQDIFPAVFASLVDSEGLFEDARITGFTIDEAAGLGRVENGVIRGGQDDGQPLFLERNQRNED